MSNFQTLTVEQLRKAVAIKEEIERLEGELDGLVGGDGASTTPDRPRRGRPPGRRGVQGKVRRTMSASAKARIAEAQRARWAKLKGSDSASTRSTVAKTTRKKKRVVDAATRARLADVARARWAKVKASGKSTL